MVVVVDVMLVVDNVVVVAAVVHHREVLAVVEVEIVHQWNNVVVGVEDIEMVVVGVVENRHWVVTFYYHHQDHLDHHPWVHQIVHHYVDEVVAVEVYFPYEILDHLDHLDEEDAYDFEVVVEVVYSHYPYILFPAVVVEVVYDHHRDDSEEDLFLVP